MSRENKFRGRRVDNGEWVYGYLIEDRYIVGPVVDWTEDYFNTEYWLRVDPDTVGQYTGLKDKNGKEIYEGDIVKGQAIKWAESGEYGGTRETLGVVKFDNARFFLWDMDTGARTALALGSAYHEVIGNIYEHSHLLETI